VILETVIVADSSPLIGLARIGRLTLLPMMAERIVVGKAVWGEVTVAAPEAPGAKAIRECGFLEVVSPPTVFAQPATTEIDAGEAEAIALAQTMTGCLLLVDDADARRVAKRLHIRHTGTVGLLRLAKQAGLIAALRPELKALMDAGIYLRAGLIEQALAQVGESS
jgi:predicted nucleic acid-binding protein